jgi:hypothetical protein
MPSTKNQLRVGRFKRGRPKSAHELESYAQKYRALTFQIHERIQLEKARGKKSSLRAMVLRYLRKAHRCPKGGFETPSFRAEEVNSDDPAKFFGPTKKGRTGARRFYQVKDFETHPHFESAYQHVKTLRGKHVDKDGNWRPKVDDLAVGSATNR